MEMKHKGNIVDIWPEAYKQVGLYTQYKVGERLYKVTGHSERGILIL